VRLSALDLAFVGLYVLFVLLSGYVLKKYVRKLADYLVAGRTLDYHLGLLSLICSELGIITYMYLAELGYKAGFAALMVGLPPLMVFLILGKTGFIVRPLLEMKMMTLPEFFQKRFGRGVRFYVGILMAVGGVLNFGVFPGVEARFINTLTGIPADAVLLTMVIMMTIVLVYTLMGGMIAILLTNYVQYIFLSLAMVAITLFGLFKIGLPSMGRAVMQNIGPAGFNPFSPNAWAGDFGIGFLVWQVLMWTAVLSGWQVVAIRMFSSKDARTGRRILAGSSMLFLARAVLPIFWGIMALALLGPGQEPLLTLPRMLVQITPRGTLGLLLGSLLAASMSTYAGYLLSWSSIISQDLIGMAFRTLMKRDLNPKQQLRLTRVTMAALMLFLIWWSLFHKVAGYLYFYLNMTIMLFIPGTLIAVAAGLYWKRARTAGAYLGFTLGALPPIVYFFTRSVSASTLGWLGFAFALAGMGIGSAVQNRLRPLSGEEVR
jgi:SSS family solute:Na+ symporter